MSEDRPVRWRKGVQVIYGARRAAICDFQSGAVYSVNGTAAAALLALEAGAPAQETSRPFTAELLARGLLVQSAPEDRPAPPQPSPRPMLDFLWIELAAGCNLGCAHCYAGSQNPTLLPKAGMDNDPAGPPLSFDEWDRVLCQAAELGCRAVQFIGGEALLDRRLFALIDRAHIYGYTFIELFTNGTLLTERTVLALARRGVRLAVSLHGTTAEVHDAVVGLAGSFRRTVEGLGRLSQQDVPFRLSGVALRQNQHDVLNLLDLGPALGAVETHIDLVRPMGDSQDVALGSGSVTLSPEVFAPDDPDVLAHRWLMAPQFVAFREQFERNRHWNTCWAGKLTVGSDGAILPCIMERAELLGNVRDRTLAEVLDSPELRRLWGITKDEVAVCRDCEYRYLCGDCRPLAAATGGNLYAKSPRCTYDPVRGDWGRPWSSERFPSPAPENEQPQIALVTPNLVFTQPTAGRRLLHLHDDCNPDRTGASFMPREAALASAA